MNSAPHAVGLKVLITRDQIRDRVAELAAQITRDYSGQSVVLVGVLKGAAIFLSDLARQIQLDTTFDFISVSSYGSGKQSSGEVRLYKDVDQSMSDKNIILVEDILDTGLTIQLPPPALSQSRPAQPEDRGSSRQEAAAVARPSTEIT